MERSEGGERPLIITIPDALREKLGSDGARALAGLLNDANMQIRGDVIEVAASRFERRLAEELGALRSELHSEIGRLRGELHAEIGQLRAEFHSTLHAELGGLRADIGAFEGRITRWMFVFRIGQTGALLGILFAFFRT